MNAEVLAVGAELVAGQIVNTNAADVSAALAGVGVAVSRHTTVGDDVDAIAGALGEALGRGDVVVLCGGLGPTHDDLTREGIAAATGRPLEEREELAAILAERFRRMGRAMSPSNLRQAWAPAGAVAIPNPAGTAPGILLEHEGRVIYALPGVPGELATMLTGFVLPDLARRSGGRAALARTIRTAGIGESDVADALAGILAPEDGIYATDGEVRVTLTDPEGEGGRLVSREEVVRARLGPVVYGGDGDTLESVVSGLLRARGLHLAVAESVTGGLLAARIVDVPGASDILVAGYVAYSAAAKIRDLGVPPAVIEAHGLVSEETARAMAAGARLRAGADVAVSTTGEAGPEAAEAAVGTVCVGLAWDGGEAAWTLRMGGTRAMIRRRACTHALNALRRWLLGELP